jgi:hypothetical protein
MLSFNISSGDLIKISYFGNTTQREDKGPGVKESDFMGNFTILNQTLESNICNPC